MFLSGTSVVTKNYDLTLVRSMGHNARLGLCREKVERAAHAY